MMRHSALYRDEKTRKHVIESLQTSMGLFENLFRNLGDVVNGFPKRIPLEDLVEREQFAPDMLENNLMFGEPQAVIDKLGPYQDLGVDEFVYLANMGLDHSVELESLQMFCNEVIPAFQK
jgi:flavin-dependent trigonelline monooxygenase, oxygenase component